MTSTANDTRISAIVASRCDVLRVAVKKGFSSPTIGGGMEGDGVYGSLPILVKGGSLLWDRTSPYHRIEGRYQRLVLLLGIIIDQSVQRDDGWVSICSGFLNEAFGDEHRRYLLSVLAEAGAIVMDEWRYSRSGRRSRRCRLSDEYAALPFEEVEIPQEYWLRYKVQQDNRREFIVASSPVLMGLWNDLQCLSLHPAYESVLPQFREEEWRKEWAWLRSIDCIERRCFSFNCALGRGRVYTTFSSTPSVLRSFALLDGDPVTAIDVTSSQPFLHGTLIEPGEEKNRYMDSVLSGRFYEDIGKAGGCGEDMSRGDLKRAVFTEVFYGRTRLVEKAPIWSAFKKLYPTLADVITVKKRENYRRLAVEMQDLEAQIIIYDAVPAMRSAASDLKVLTVHDAIYVNEEYIPLAKEVLAAAFMRHTGYAPALKVETSNPRLLRR